MRRTPRPVRLCVVAVAVLAAVAGALAWRHESEAPVATCTAASGPPSQNVAFATLRMLAAAYADGDRACVDTLTTNAYTSAGPSDRLVQSLINRKGELSETFCRYSEATAHLLCTAGAASFALSIGEHDGHVLAEGLTGTDGQIG